MKFYELTYLISPDIKEQELGSFSEKISASIKNEGGIFDNSVKPIKKNLTYPIKKKMAAYYQTINFYLTPEKIKSLKNFLGREKNILRFIILGKKMAGAKKFKPMIERVPKFPLVEEKRKAREEKIELEKIDKKLEEILGNI